MKSTDSVIVKISSSILKMEIMIQSEFCMRLYRKDTR